MKAVNGSESVCVTTDLCMVGFREVSETLLACPVKNCAAIAQLFSVLNDGVPPLAELDAAIAGRLPRHNKCGLYVHGRNTVFNDPSAQLQFRFTVSGEGFLEFCDGCLGGTFTDRAEIA